MQFENKPAKLLIILMVSVLALPACKSKEDASKTGPKPNPPVAVDVMIAEAGPVEDIVEANGTVVANEFLEIHPEVSGRLTFLNISEGHAVTKGTVLARINNADLVAQMNKTKVQLDLAEKTEARYKQLLALNGMNQSEYDAALNQVNALKADIAYTQTLIDKTVIKAPFDGVLGLRQVSPGAYVTPATVLATLQQVSQVKIDFTLPQSYSGVIRIGSLVDVQLDDAEQLHSKALIVATEPGANIDTRNLKVRALLKGGKPNPGGFVKVYINAGKGRSAIKVPANCLIPNDKSNQLVLVKKGMASFADVQTGIREANTVEITGGINPGDSVVVRGVLFAKPKAPLKVRSVKKLDELLSAGPK